MDRVVTGNNIINLVERGKTSIQSAVLSKGVMTDDSAKYSIISAFPLDLKINSTINIFGKTYRVNNKPEYTKTAENSYLYSVEFQGVLYDLRNVMFFNADDNGFKTTSDFTLIGNIELFLLAIKNNLKRFSLDWIIGTFENTDTKTIAFSKDNCLTALQKICQEFAIEFRIDNVNDKNIINVGNFGRELSYTFEFGKGNGLYDLASTNVDENGIVNRMYVAGGTQNLPTAYREYSTNLKLPDAEYLEDSTSIELLGLKEGFMDFPDIFPSRTGVISAIDTNKRLFFDTSMDFDLNEKETDGSTRFLISGTSAKVHFNTGNLAGYEFEIKNYNHLTKQFEILSYENDQNVKFPSETSEAFQLQVGDEYVILDIYYPEIYVTNAEQKLLEKAAEQFPLNLQPKVNYKLNVDSEFLKNKVAFPEDLPFDLGDTVTVVDDDLGVNKKIKIVSFTRDILNPFNYKIEIADSYDINSASQVALQIAGINTNVKSQNSVISQNYKNGFRRINEIQELVFDTDGYFDSTKIKPLSIETNLLSVGARSQQLTLEGVTIEANYQNENSIRFSGGKLIHFSISDTIREWIFVETIITDLDPLEAYYVYAKCDKTTNVGEFFTTTEKIKFDEKPIAYYFLLGVLHKVSNGFRFYTALEGATVINGRYITTGRIQSVDNSTWFDLDLAAFNLGGTAGMTGKGEENEVFIWGGGSYEDRENAKRAITKKGVDIWRHPSGQVGFEMGIVDDRLVLNGYAKNGAKLYELSDRGFLAVSYIPESWTAIVLFKLTFNNYTFDSFLITDELTAAIARRAVKITDTSNGGSLEWRISYTLVKNLTAYEYYNGTHPDNDQYLDYIGFKKVEDSRTDNVDPGWYVQQVGEIFTAYSNTGTQQYTFYVTVVYIQGGKITQTKTITINK